MLPLAFYFSETTTPSDSCIDCSSCNASSFIAESQFVFAPTRHDLVGLIIIVVVIVITTTVTIAFIILAVWYGSWSH